MRPRLRALAAALLLMLLGAGCAGVPERSEVQVVRSVPAGPQPVPASGPEPNASPFRVVRGFIEATGNPANGHAAARAFLTDRAAASWRDGHRVTIIANFPDVTPQVVPDAPPGTARVVVRADRIGTLGPNGAFQPDGGQIQLVLSLVQRRGEWRITDPPPGVLVQSLSFARNYRPVTVSFLAPGGGNLVPDLRWVPNGPEGTLPGRVLDLLLAGPSERLADGVFSALPSTARTRSNVLVGPNGRTVVDLAGVRELTVRQRRLAATQIVGTLAGLVPAPIRVLADGKPLVAGKPTWRRADISSYSSAAGPQPDVPGLVVYGGRLRTLDGRPVSGPAGSGRLQVLSAALSSPEGSRLAVVAAGPNGRPQLLVGPRGQGLTPVGLDAESMTRPTWGPSGTEVWTVLDGETVAAVVLPDTGAPATYQVAAAELTELGTITDLRLSRDGVHVAAIAGGKLVVATVVRGPSEVSIRNPRVLREFTLGPSVSVDWAGLDQLVVASAGSPPQVAVVSVDGLSYDQLANTNLTAPLSGVVAAPGREIVVSDANGLWAYSKAQYVWEPLLGGIGPGAVPIYPG